MKRIVLISALVFGAVINCLGQIPSDSLSVYFPFNGNSQDESGNGLHATPNGATLSTDRFLNPNSAYVFNGINDHMEFPYSDLLQVDFPFSISIWVNIETFSTQTSVLFTNDESDYYSGFWILYNPDGRVSAGYGDGTGFGAQYRKTKHSTVWLEAGNWHHIVASFNDLDDIDLYIDCEEDPGFYSGTGTNLMNNGQSGVIGRDLGSHVNSYHHGAIDDIRVYRKSLSSDEALSLCEEIDSTVSVREFEANETILEVFPNPVRNEVNITLDKNYPVNGVSVTVIDLSGRIVAEREFTQSALSISTEGWGNSGMYFAQIRYENGNKLETIKLVKE